MELNDVTELQIDFRPFLSRDVWIGFRSVAKVVFVKVFHLTFNKELNGG